MEGHLTKERGILILSKKTCGYEISNLELLDATNTLQFDLNSLGGEVYNIVAVYAPDGYTATYWTQLHKKLTGRSRQKQLIIGDFNTTLDPILDRQNYDYDNHIQSRKVINSWINSDEYLDAFRYIYPESRNFSWRWDGNQRSKKDKKKAG